MKPNKAIKYTCSDFLLLPDDGKRYEIIEGELYMTPAPNASHQRVAGRIYRLRKMYAKFGVREYWVVDPNNGTIDIFRLRKRNVKLEGSLTAKDVLATPLLPGLAVAVSEIFPK